MCVRAAEEVRRRRRGGVCVRTGCEEVVRREVRRQDLCVCAVVCVWA